MSWLKQPKAALSDLPQNAQLLHPTMIRGIEKGQVKESEDPGRSLCEDVKQTSKRKVKPRYGDKGDQPDKSDLAKKNVSKKSAGK